MADMYKRIDSLLSDRGISGAKMSSDLGMSRSFMTELRKGRAKSVKIETAQRIADYFGVSVSYLLGEDEETKKAHTEAGEHLVDMSDVDIAFYGGYKELTEEQQEAVRRMVQAMRGQQTQKNSD